MKNKMDINVKRHPLDIVVLVELLSQEVLGLSLGSHRIHAVRKAGMDSRFALLSPVLGQKSLL